MGRPWVASLSSCAAARRPQTPWGYVIDQVARAGRGDGSLADRVAAALVVGLSLAVDDMPELVAAGLPARMEGGLALVASRQRLALLERARGSCGTASRPGGVGRKARGDARAASQARARRSGTRDEQEGEAEGGG